MTSTHKPTLRQKSDGAIIELLNYLTTGKFMGDTRAQMAKAVELANEAKRLKEAAFRQDFERDFGTD